MRTSERIISSLILTLVLSFFLVNSSYAQIGSGALKCDGVDDFVTILDANGDFDLGSSMTIEAMVRHDSYTGLGSAVGGYSGRYSLGQVNNGVPAFTISIPTTSSAYGPDQMPLASWVHLAGTYDGTDIKVYVNGTLAGTTNHPGTTSGISELHFCRFMVGSSFLDGAIDEVRIWNIVRTEQEISATKSVALNGNETGLVGYYQFEEGSGQDVLDSSTGGNHGVLGATNLAESDDPTRETLIAPTTFTVGGTVSGLTGTGLELENMGADTLPVAAAATAFTFATELEVGVSYVVTVSTEPTGQTCTVSNGSGTISDADVTDVAVTCTDNPEPLYTINGTASGLGPISVVLQNNGTDNLDVDANGVFVFDTALSDGSPYDVTVLTQPAGQTCGVTNGSGTVNGSDVLGVDVGCQDDVVVPPVLPTEPIPVMSEWALILLTMFLGLMVFANRRRLF
jgi:hypothetical protein